MEQETGYPQYPQIEITRSEMNVPPNVRRLQQFVSKEIVPLKNRHAMKFLGHWEPLFGSNENPEITQYMYEVFSTLKGRIPQTDAPPVLIDCGAGLGDIGMAASLAGFDTYNLEVIDRIQALAQHVRDSAVSQGIISPSNLHTVHASYYLPETFDTLIPQFYQEYFPDPDNPSQTQIDMALFSLGCNAEQIQGSSMRTVEDHIRTLKQRSETFASLPFVSPNSVNASVIFCYPSDPFMTYTDSFISQWERTLPSGSLLVLTEINQQVQDLLQQQAFERWKFQGQIQSSGRPSLLVFEQP